MQVRRVCRMYCAAARLPIMENALHGTLENMYQASRLGEWNHLRRVLRVTACSPRRTSAWQPRVGVVIKTFRKVTMKLAELADALGRLHTSSIIPPFPPSAEHVRP